MNNDGCDDNKTNQGPNCYKQLIVRKSFTWHFMQGCFFFSKMSFEIRSSQYTGKNGTDTNRTKMATKECFSPRLDIRCKWFQTHNCWQSSQENNHKCQNNQSPNIQSNRSIIKHGPWDNSTKINKK